MSRLISRFVSFCAVAGTVMILSVGANAQVGTGGVISNPGPTSGGANTGGSIFNTTTGTWSNSGWNSGGLGTGGLGSLGGIGGSFGGGWRVGQNFGGIGGPGGGISVGRTWVGAGTGAGGGLGFGGYNEQINAAACTLLGIPMGSFGALVMIFAGIIAIVSGALGAYKMALSTIVVGAGSWILFPIVQMFFPVQCGF